MKNDRREPVVLHPFLLGIYPILALYAANADEVSLSALARPLGVSLVCILAFYALLSRTLKDRYKAGILASAAALGFFYYVRIFETVAFNHVMFGFHVGRHRLFLPIYMIVLMCGSTVVIRTRMRLGGLSVYLNAFAVALISLLIITSLTNTKVRPFKSAHTWAEVVKGRCQTIKPSKRLKGPLRDIYYIVLDSYARSDVLGKHFQCDNTDFIDHLRTRGFFVGDKSRSNYIYTYGSLACSLNCDYIQAFYEPLGTKSAHAILTQQMIEDSTVYRLLKSFGYKFVFFPSAYQATSSNRYADIKLSPALIDISEFEQVLIRNSVVQAFDCSPSAHRKRVLYAFEKLKDIPRINAPTFTFAHIVCPHAPFVFDRDGNPSKQGFVQGVDAPLAQTRRLYADQLLFVSKQMAQIVDDILARSKVAPIIIIQGDHGPMFMVEADDASKKADSVLVRRSAKEMEVMTRILNAYYLPEGGDKLLYSSISPVNSFRVILNHYFGTDLKMLDDVCYENALDRSIRKERFVVAPD